MESRTALRHVMLHDVIAADVIAAALPGRGLLRAGRERSDDGAFGASCSWSAVSCGVVGDARVVIS